MKKTKNALLANRLRQWEKSSCVDWNDIELVLDNVWNLIARDLGRPKKKPDKQEIWSYDLLFTIPVPLSLL